MKKMDEMNRNIRLKSEEYGFKFVLLTLIIWTLYECCLSISNSQPLNSLPSLILIGALIVQGFSEMFMKRKMILDDEEYEEPNKVVWSIILSIAGVSIILSVGAYLFFKMN
ncbi:hypothetical protein [Fusibacter ferrireducens]|uniref:Uncharacterized protein n=1 Tax=Fusibacter ferrireducens TaxID=2785058 RepID=A0ABR9ZWS1_9FIRM|nr:hypothetical protein [Fusibacter ferrireducens]MBF4694396.1 hypothetical protein [Fusibacter ferrireducens]